MCILSKEISEFRTTKEDPIVGIRLWKFSSEREILGLQNQKWDGKTCIGNIDLVKDDIPLGIYSYNNYNNYNNNYNNNYYNNNYYYNYYNNNYYYYNNYNNYYYNYYVLGEVILWGRIKQHELGYRAEFGEVKTLFLLDEMVDRNEGFIDEFNKKSLELATKFNIPTMTEYEYLAL